jgi:hypothetical protein
MFRRTSEKYVILQDTVSSAEQRVIERAVVAVLPPVQPSPAFVAQLGHDLIAEARQRQQARPEQARRFLQFLGILSGGIFSVLGGITIWLLLDRSQQRNSADLKIPPTPSRQTASASSA